MERRAESTRSGTTPRRVGRPSGPTEQGAATRNTIIRAAASIFSRLGYDRARVADVIEASGLTRGAVYFHFESKEALAIAVLSAQQDEWIATVEREIERADPGLPRLRALLPAILAAHQADTNAWAVARLTQSLAELPSTRELAAAKTRRWVDVVAVLIEEAQGDAGGHSTEDPTMLATVVVGAFDGLKATVNVLSEDDPAAAQHSLRDGGMVLERMLFSTLNVRD